MAQTAKYSLYVVGTSEDPTVRDWVNRISGESDSNMTKIDEALDAMNSKISSVSKDVQEISSIGTIYDSASALPTLTETDSGMRYCALTDGELPIVLYEWDGDTLTWKTIDLVKGSSLYIAIDENATYRYEDSSPYFYIVGSNVPIATSNNEGQFLRVINGTPTWSTVLTAEEAKFGV